MEASHLKYGARPLVQQPLHIRRLSSMKPFDDGLRRRFQSFVLTFLDLMRYRMQV